MPNSDHKDNPWPGGLSPHADKGGSAGPEAVGSADKSPCWDIVRSFPNKLTVSDLEGRLVFSNWKERGLLRPQRATDPAPQCWLCFFRGDRECMNCQVREVLRTGRRQYKEVYNPVQSKFSAVSHFPVHDSQGRISMVAELVEDVTRARRTEHDLLAAKNAAEAADRAKSAFLATMSHEIRTPMNGVLGMLDLAMDTELDEEQREYLEAAQVSAESLLGLVNNILDFSKIEAGVITLDEQPFEPAKRVQLMRTMFAPRAEEKGLKFELAVAENLPEVVLGDPQRVRQILVNLLGNALKFTDEGGFSLSVRMIAETESQAALEFAVKDSGIGLSKDQLRHIFDRFKQVDSSASRRHQGTGLGLAISRSLAQLMGGEIEVESEPDKGSTFYFRAPFAKVASRSQRPADRQAAEPGRAGGATLLVAEDHPINTMFIERLLRKHGYIVHCVQNGAAVLDAVAKHKYDLILMDIAMPVLDGLEATRRLRRLHDNPTAANVPVIAMTAHALKGDREKFLAEGMSDYIGKPINSRLLLSMLQEHLQAS